MNDSTFDPDMFLEMQTEGEMQTSFTPVPAGDYPATVDDLKLRSGQTKDGSTWHAMDVLWEIDNAELRQQLDMEKIIVKQNLFLDVGENGQLLMGPNKNVRLGRVREALGQNGPGAWSPIMLKGAGPASITVTQRPDDNDESVIYNDVKKVSPLS